MGISPPLWPHTVDPPHAVNPIDLSVALFNSALSRVGLRFRRGSGAGASRSASSWASGSHTMVSFAGRFPISRTIIGRPELSVAMFRRYFSRSTCEKVVAAATVRTLDGRTLEETVLQARGSTEQPLSNQELEAKVRELARHGAFSGRIDDVIAAAWELDTLGTIHPLIDAARLG